MSASSSYVQIISGSIFENIRFTFASFKQNKYLLQENKNLRDQILQIGTKDFIEKKDNEDKVQITDFQDALSNIFKTNQDLFLHSLYDEKQ